MYTSTFTFLPGDFTDEFHALDQKIAEIARSIPGYLGEESWENARTGQVSNVYYWHSLSALQQLVSHPEHLKAKTAQAKWLRGYQVVIAHVQHSYGDGLLDHPARM